MNSNRAEKLKIIIKLEFCECEINKARGVALVNAVCVCRACDPVSAVRSSKQGANECEQFKIHQHSRSRQSVCSRLEAPSLPTSYFVRWKPRAPFPAYYTYSILATIMTWKTVCYYTCEYGLLVIFDLWQWVCSFCSQYLPPPAGNVQQNDVFDLSAMCVFCVMCVMCMQSKVSVLGTNAVQLNLGSRRS